MTNFLIDSSFPKQSPMSNAMYFASFFKAGKPSMMICFNKLPSRVIMKMHAPAHLRFNALSTCNCHMFLVQFGLAQEALSALEIFWFFMTSFFSSANGVNSITKSTNTQLLQQSLVGYVVLTEFVSPFHELLRSMRVVKNLLKRKFCHDDQSIRLVVGS